jgi:hypothetical protein
MKYTFLLLSLLVFLSCAQDQEGKIVTDVDFPEGQYEDFDFSVTDEKDLCQSIDQEVLKKHFPDAANFNLNPVGLSRYGSNNGGCRLAWTPSENVSRKKSGNYFHASSEGSIELKFNKNAKPDHIERFAQRSLNQKVKPPENNEYINELDFDYLKVNGVGSFAVWNDGTSTLEFAMGDNYLFAISVKYPRAPEERLQIAKDIALAFIAEKSNQ